jgi:flagellar basal body rod protein FlgG
MSLKNEIKDLNKVAQRVTNLASPNSNVNLTEEIPKSLMIQRTFEAKIKILQTKDTIQGTTIDIKR